MTPSGNQNAARPKGVLIALEGIDGTGKSTHAALLAEWLGGRGLQAVVLHEPTDGQHGREIKRLARAGRLDPEAEFQLFLLDRQENAEHNILPALREGKVAILDRYYISSMAYQGARGVDSRLIQLANERVAPRPDLIFLFDLPVEEALARINNRDLEGPNLFEHHEYLLKVQKIFKNLNWPEVRHVDATMPVDAIQAQIQAETEKLLKERGLMPAG